MYQVSLGGRRTNLSSHQVDYVVVPKVVDDWDQALSSVGGCARRSDMNTAGCKHLEYIRDGNINRLQDEEAVDYPFQRPKMTNSNYISGTNMSLLDYNTEPTWTGEPPCTVADYISRFLGCRVVGRGAFGCDRRWYCRSRKHIYYLLRNGDWMVPRRHCAMVCRSLGLTVVVFIGLLPEVSSITIVECVPLLMT